MISLNNGTAVTEQALEVINGQQKLLRDAEALAISANALKDEHAVMEDMRTRTEVILYMRTLSYRSVVELKLVVRDAKKLFSAVPVDVPSYLPPMMDAVLEF